MISVVVSDRCCIISVRELLLLAPEDAIGCCGGIVLIAKKLFIIKVEE